MSQIQASSIGKTERIHANYKIISVSVECLVVHRDVEKTNGAVQLIEVNKYADRDHLDIPTSPRRWRGVSLAS